MSFRVATYPRKNERTASSTSHDQYQRYILKITELNFTCASMPCMSISSKHPGTKGACKDLKQRAQKTY